MRLSGLIAALLLLATPVLAADRAPAILPSRDVAVLYSVSGRAAQQVRQVMMRFSAAQRLLRLDSRDFALGYLLVDPARLQARMVMNNGRQMIDLPLAKDRRARLLWGEGLEFRRRGTARVAGRACTLWDVTSGRDSATTCLTPDGVLLRAQGRTGDAAGTTLEAIRVDETAQPPGLFHPPAGAGAFRLPDVLKPLLQNPR